MKVTYAGITQHTIYKMIKREDKTHRKTFYRIMELLDRVPSQDMSSLIELFSLEVIEAFFTMIFSNYFLGYEIVRMENNKYGRSLVISEFLDCDTFENITVEGIELSVGHSNAYKNGIGSMKRSGTWKDNEEQLVIDYTENLRKTELIGSLKSTIDDLNKQVNIFREQQQKMDEMAKEIVDLTNKLNKANSKNLFDFKGEVVDVKALILTCNELLKNQEMANILSDEEDDDYEHDCKYTNGIVEDEDEEDETETETEEDEDEESEEESIDNEDEDDSNNNNSDEDSDEDSDEEDEDDEDIFSGLPVESEEETESIDTEEDDEVDINLDQEDEEDSIQGDDDLDDEEEEVVSNGVSDTVETPFLSRQTHEATVKNILTTVVGSGNPAPSIASMVKHANAPVTPNEDSARGKEFEGLVRTILGKIKQNNPKMFLDLNDKIIRKSCNAVYDLINIDGFESDEVEEVLLWAADDSFWQTQFHSIVTVRKTSENGQMKFVNMYNKWINTNVNKQVSDEDMAELEKMIEAKRVK